MIWTLSDTLFQKTPLSQKAQAAAQNNTSPHSLRCDQKIILDFSYFIQQDYRELTTGQSEFREQVIYPLFLSIARLGIRNNNPLAMEQLTAIVLNHEINDYFRAVATEALQNFGVFSPLGIQGLHHVIGTVNKRFIKESRFNPAKQDLIKEELIQNENDEKARRYAFELLVELADTRPRDFLAFLSFHTEDLNTNQTNLVRAFEDLPLPADNSADAVSVLNRLRADSDMPLPYKNMIDNFCQAKQICQ